MKSRAAIAQYEATIVLVMISLSLASVVYTSLRRESSLAPEPLFVNEETPIGGSPAIQRLEVNSSSATTISSFSLDEASSSAGVLAFDGSSYSTTKSLCAAGMITFFAVFASQPGTLEVTTDGKSWVSGTWGGTVGVSSGWQEVMIKDGTSCTLTLPGGESVPGQWSPSSPLLSSIPVEGPLTGTSFTVYIPGGGGSHSLLMTSSGGLDSVSL
ncbi:MAG TPA: hypothetical protein VND41_02755 [Nitrososphaerales archaeon]|nr:hypothetical protein [Nitrososphaerales archaeon]